MEEDDMVMRVGSSLRMRGDEPMRREGLQARGIYKEVSRPSRGLALATTKRSLTVRLPVIVFYRITPSPT